MKPLAIELDDRAISLARNGRILSSAPSAVFDGTTGDAAGSNAWQELRSHPRATSTRHLSTVLRQRSLSARAEKLVAAELKTRFAEQVRAQVSLADECIWIAAPAQAEEAGLAAVLGITRRLELPVGGFIDSAAVITAALGSQQDTIVLEVGLHHAAATAVNCQGAQARRKRTVLTEIGGYIELNQAWLDLIGITMVRRTRFDPLHDAATEQQLFDAMPSVTGKAASTGRTTAAVTKGNERYEVALTRDQFAHVAEPIYRSIRGLLHQLRPAGTLISIVVPRRVAELPGLREQLEQFVGSELVSIPDGFAAAATSLLDLPEPPPDDDSVRLLRRLPIQSRPGLAEGVTRELLGQRRSDGPAPSHVLLDGRAYSLSAESLVIGRAPEGQGAPSISASTPSTPVALLSTPAATSSATLAATSGATLSTPAASGANSTSPVLARYITLSDGLAGVSRRHCTFVHEGDGLVLLDHSTFGTFVNTERVQERVRVHAGDRVRIGEPGVELGLISVGGLAATNHQP